LWIFGAIGETGEGGGRRKKEKGKRAEGSDLLSTFRRSNVKRKRTRGSGKRGGKKGIEVAIFDFLSNHYTSTKVLEKGERIQKEKGSQKRRGGGRDIVPAFIIPSFIQAGGKKKRKRKEERGKKEKERRRERNLFPDTPVSIREGKKKKNLQETEGRGKKERGEEKKG